MPPPPEHFLEEEIIYYPWVTQTSWVKGKNKIKCSLDVFAIIIVLIERYRKSQPGNHHLVPTSVDGKGCRGLLTHLFNVVCLFVINLGI